MVRATFAPAHASSPIPGLFRLAHFLCAGGPSQSAHNTDWPESGPPKLLSGSSSICGDLPGSSRTRARRTRKLFNLDGDDFGAQHQPPILGEIFSTVSSTTCGTGKSTICPWCVAESAPDTGNGHVHVLLCSTILHALMKLCSFRTFGL